MPDKTIAIYARQSIDRKDSLSIDGQIDLCKSEAGQAPVSIYQDKGYSGKNTKRPEFTRLMQDVMDGKISKIICYRLDRISRSITDFGYIWECLSSAGVEFVSVNERFDTSTPSGRAMLYIIMVFAQLERETIAERVKDNYYQRVKTGAWPGGPAPYGFEVHKKKGQPCKLAPSDGLEIVPRLFALYAAPGASLGSVCRWLNENQIPCSRRQSWDTVSLNRLLRHPAYVKADASVYAYYKAKGLIIANEIDDFNRTVGALIVGKRSANDRKYANLRDHLLALSTHDGIVEPDIFLACQYKLDSNKPIKNSGKGKYTWLSGKLKCGACGYSLKVLNDKRAGRQYLICSGRTNLNVCSERHSEKLPEVEASVMAQIQDHLQSSATRAEAADADLTELKASLAAINGKIDNLIQSISQASGITMRYINAELERLDELKNKLLGQMGAAGQRAIAMHGYGYLDFDSVQFDDLKNLAGALIDRVYCTTDKTEVVWL